VRKHSPRFRPCLDGAVLEGRTLPSLAAAVPTVAVAGPSPPVQVQISGGSGAAGGAVPSGATAAMPSSAIGPAPGLDDIVVFGPFLLGSALVPVTGTGTDATGLGLPTNLGPTDSGPGLGGNSGAGALPGSPGAHAGAIPRLAAGAGLETGPSNTGPGSASSSPAGYGGESGVSPDGFPDGPPAAGIEGNVPDRSGATLPYLSRQPGDATDPPSSDAAGPTPRGPARGPSGSGQPAGPAAADGDAGRPEPSVPAPAPVTDPSGPEPPQEAQRIDLHLPIQAASGPQR
jgi:hypothetical protein